MKTMNKFLAAAVVALMAGCGGGGGSDGGSVAPSNPTPTNPTPDAATVVNPVTGLNAPGTQTKVLNGIAPKGATVTAYTVKSDGSSGEVLGSTTANSIAGEFTINMATAPTGAVRLVATSSYKRAADDTNQQVDMQLISPYVTTALRDFKITPMSDVAARIMTAKAARGVPLGQAFTGGMLNLLGLDNAYAMMENDPTVHINVLRGSIKSDLYNYAGTSTTARQMLNAIEYFGVMYDLPSKDVWRVLGAAGESNFPVATVDGAGQPINAGAWVNGSFDPTAPQSLKALMNAKTPADQKVTDAATGTLVAPSITTIFRRNLTLDFDIEYACTFGFTGELTSRYAFYQLDSQGKVPKAECDAAIARLTDLRGRVATNNVSRTAP
jgi:hypothetical protein